jgi:glycosyltransferase involved in cell wall biosynthesis
MRRCSGARKIRGAGRLLVGMGVRRLTFGRRSVDFDPMEEKLPDITPSIKHLLVSIVIPAYNEEKAVGPVIDEVREAMGRTDYRYEILVVDDCSTDRTVELARGEGVRVVERSVNGGSGSSRRTGVLAAHGEIVVMLDGDGSYTAADIPKLLDRMPAYDQVNGARTSEQGTLKWLRAPAKWLIRMLACYLTRTRIPDLNTGLKAFRRDVMLEYLWVLPKGFSCVTTMTLAFLCNGYSVAYVPTTYRKRIGRSKFHPITDTANYIGTVLRMVMFFRPLRFFGPLALVLLAASIGMGIWDFLRTHSLQEVDILLFVAGVVTLSLGMITELVVRQRQTSEREIDYWREVYRESDSPPSPR